MSANTSFSEILSTTLKNYRKTLTDNVFDKRALGYWLMRNGAMEMKTGQSIVEQIITAKNSTFGYYSGWDPIDLTPQDSISAAEYNWGQAAVSVVVNGLEKFQNSGPEQLADLVKARIKIAEETMSQAFNKTFLQSDGTGTSGKEWLGLVALVGDATTSPTTVGGIDCTTTANAFWRSSVVTGADTTLTTKLVSAAIDNATFGDAPDFAITTLALYEAYEALLVAKMQYMDVAAANAGFKTLSNRGVTIFWDRDCIAKSWWNLSSKHLSLVGGKGRWMVVRPFIEPEDKDGSSSLILSYGQLTTDSRRNHSVVKNFIP